MAIKMLDDLCGLQRIFTYKVMFDGGTAPNPFGGVCTLAICKPAIRRVAKPGDLIVGLAPGNEGRIVYCMKVTDKKSWKEYIELCTNISDKQDEYLDLSQKIPKSVQDQGDCIWRNANIYEAVRPTYSEHEGKQTFEDDVINGRSVLLSKNFLYLGKGDKLNIQLPDSLKPMIPGRGHRSNANNSFRAQFVEFFNHQVSLQLTGKFGVHGTPEHAPENTEKSTCSSC